MKHSLFVFLFAAMIGLSISTVTTTFAQEDGATTENGASTAAQPTTALDEAKRISAMTGKPLFVVSGKET